ncbi:glycoside hydrolase family 32 protein [Halobacillus aidingensis]|uniref:Fructan beta-fructosidase n=1 Tax=Halobacillus aidingensis TaxID=240303 RepID=A0A1H0LYE0_HALAD|nr:glycoside hydrolase family 32 protein [Halobacillus aidingensis]SDO73218.1 fructan beta-fructosidase [Halobacillus aidingensis]
MIQSQPVTTNGYYEERYRPHIHFTPEQMWMNDPNGLVYFEGEYHLFYQYHPDSKQWGPMHWGHAVSKDLITWEHLPVALYPDTLGMIFSGSAVVDHKDTSGFFDGKPGLVAVFTHADGDLQRQSIAYSKDHGRTWVKYDDNPVIPNPGIKDFRDPKVFWHEETEKWVMVLAAGRKVQFYTSTDLKQWTYVSEFGEGWGEQKGVWECPDLFSLTNETTGEKKWVLPIGIDAGAPSGGSGTQYFIGSFDGKHFVPHQSKETVRWLDYGKDFYASQSFSDLPGRRVVLAWMSNWQYANDVPTDPWRSAMTIPRELTLSMVEGQERLIQKPVAELTSLIEKKMEKEPFFLQEKQSTELDQPASPFIWEWGVEIEKGGVFEARLFGKQDGGLRVRIDRGKNTLYVQRDRADLDFSKEYACTCQAPLNGDHSSFHLKLVCDHSSVEIFLGDGEISMTNVYLPAADHEAKLKMEAVRGTVEVKQSSVSELKSIWKPNA